MALLNTDKRGFPYDAYGNLLSAPITRKLYANFAYHINPRTVKTTLVAGGTVTKNSDSLGVLSTSTTTSSSATLESRQSLNYENGLGSVVRFTAIFSSGVTGTTQVIGLGNSDNGYFFGYNGVDFGILRRQDGVDTWVSKSSWNVSKFSSFDPTKGNVFQIRFQAAFGAIDFLIGGSSTGRFKLVHRVKYSNNFLVPSVYNSSLPLHAKVDNGSTTLDIILKIGSMAAFVEGKSKDLGLGWAIENDTTFPSNTETLIVALRNLATFNGVTNQQSAFIKQFAASVIGPEQTAMYKFYMQAAVSGGSWSDISTNKSVIESNTTATLSSGDLAGGFMVGRDMSDNTDLDKLNLVINPGEIFVATVEMTGDNGRTFSSLSWTEEV